MKCPKKALAFIGAVALLFQGGCSAPDQENRENWETVIECQYEDMGISPNQQFLIAKKGGLYGAYVKNGDSYELKIPFQYEKILCNIYSDDSLFCYYPETGLLDIYGKDGEKLQNRPFSSMENYTRRLAEGGYTVSYDEKEQGYISKEGEWILHPVYSQIEPLKDGTFITLKDDKYNWVDKEGKSLLPSEPEVEIDLSSTASSSTDSYVAVTVQDPISWNKSMGILGKDGDFVIPPEYDEAYAGQDDEGNFFFMCKTSDGKGYVKDINNSVLFEYDSRNTVLPAGDRCFIVIDSIKIPSVYGLLSETGEWIFPMQYERIQVSGEMAAVTDSAGTWLYDTEGNRLSETPYDTLLMPEGDLTQSEPLAFFQGEGEGLKFGFTSGDGAVSIPAVYDSLYYGPFPYNDLLMVSRDGKWGCVDYQNNTKIEFQYSNVVTPFTEEDYAYVTRGDAAGIINTQGETVVPFMFEDLGVENAMEGAFLAGDMAVVKKDGQYGCIRVHSYTK